MASTSALGALSLGSSPSSPTILRQDFERQAKRQTKPRKLMTEQFEAKQEKKPPIEVNSPDEALALCHALGSKLGGDLPFISGITEIFVGGAYKVDNPEGEQQIRKKIEYYKDNYTGPEILLYMLTNMGGGKNNYGARAESIPDNSAARQASIENTQTGLQAAREKMGLPHTKTEPPSVAIEKENLNKGDNATV